MNHLQKSIKILSFSEKLDFFEKNGITISEINKLHDSDQQFAIISADRPGELSRNENKRRKTEMVKLLNELGYPWESSQGSWPVEGESGKKYMLEDSFLIYDISYDDAIMVGEFFDQEAILFKPYNEFPQIIDLKTGEITQFTNYEVDLDKPRPRFQEDEIEPETRFRDTVLKYSI